MLAAMGVGLVAGGRWASQAVGERGVRVPYVTSIAVMAIGIGATAAAPNVWVAAAVLVLAGVGNGVALVCNALLVQLGVPDAARGRAFTLAMSASYAALGLGMVVAGPATDALGAREVWAISAGLVGVASAAALALTNRVSLVDQLARERPATSH